MYIHDMHLVWTYYGYIYTCHIIRYDHTHIIIQYTHTLLSYTPCIPSPCLGHMVNEDHLDGCSYQFVSIAADGVLMVRIVYLMYIYDVCAMYEHIIL